MSDFHGQPSETDLGELAALADGSLPEARRAKVEARVVGSAVLGAELTRQRRALAAMRAANAEVHAPAGLRARVEALEHGETPAGEEPHRAPVERRRRMRWGGIGIAAAAAAAALALFVLPAGDPTVDEAAELAAEPAAEPAPAPQPGEPALLTASFEGLAYPDWEREFGWRAVGERSDELDGRHTRTVLYENRDGARIGYTIVAGEALEPPSDGESANVNGVELEAFAVDGQSAVTWLREGHTCVLAGEGVERSTLLELAAWMGDGAVTF
jgi:hypothetical protein